MTRTVTTTTTTTTVTTTTTTEEEKQRRDQLLDSTYFSKVQPLSNRGLLVRNYDAGLGSGVITVIITRINVGADRFFCKVGAIGDVLLPLEPRILQTDPTPAGHFQLRRVGPLPQRFQVQLSISGINATAPPGNAPAGDPPPPPTQNNQKILIGVYNAGGDLIDSEEVRFIAVPQQSIASVNATSSLFFTYSAGTAALPNAPDEKFPNCRPYMASVPIDCAHVLISVKPTAPGTPQKWYHSGGHGGLPAPPAPNPNYYSAEGQKDDDDFTDDGTAAHGGTGRPSYMTATLRSQNIMPLVDAADKVGRWEGLLTGMWDFGFDAVSGEPVASTEVMAIGPGLKDGAELLLTVPTATSFPVKNLMLGSHQEMNWGKASGSLDVQLEWS